MLSCAKNFSRNITEQTYGKDSTGGYDKANSMKNNKKTGEDQFPTRPYRDYRPR